MDIKLTPDEIDELEAILAAAWAKCPLLTAWISGCDHIEIIESGYDFQWNRMNDIFHKIVTPGKVISRVEAFDGSTIHETTMPIGITAQDIDAASKMIEKTGKLSRKP